MLTFIKPRGLLSADVFRGTRAGPGSLPGLWERIVQQLDRINNTSEIKISDRIIEFDNGDEIPSPHLNKDRHFRLDLYLNGKLYSLHGNKCKSLKIVLNWINSHVSIEEFSEISESDDTNLTHTQNSPNDAIINDEIPDLIPLDDSKNNDLVAGLAGGSVFFAAFAFAGVVLGNVWADAEHESKVNDDWGLFINDDGSIVKFDNDDSNFDN